jgi:hypothetical protein
LVELCIHVANVFYLASFLGRDMLCLRTLTCAGLVLGLVFFTCQPMPLYGPVVWHIVFLFINLYQIRQLLRERRRLDLTAEQQSVAETALGHLSREDLLTLLTRVMYTDPRRVGDIAQVCRRPLSPEELALRDIAFSRLSRKELLNLATRRLWHSLGRLNPARWRRKPRPGPAATAGRVASDTVKARPVDSRPAGEWGLATGPREACDLVGPPLGGLTLPTHQPFG